MWTFYGVLNPVFAEKRHRPFAQERWSASAQMIMVCGARAYWTMTPTQSRRTRPAPAGVTVTRHCRLPWRPGRVGTGGARATGRLNGPGRVLSCVIVWPARRRRVGSKGGQVVGGRQDNGETLRSPADAGMLVPRPVVPNGPTKDWRVPFRRVP